MCELLSYISVSMVGLDHFLVGSVLSQLGGSSCTDPISHIMYKACWITLCWDWHEPTHNLNLLIKSKKFCLVSSSLIYGSNISSCRRGKAPLTFFILFRFPLFLPVSPLVVLLLFPFLLLQIVPSATLLHMRCICMAVNHMLPHTTF